MKLCDALKLLRQIPADGSIIVWLACGFTPLHLKTLLAAEIWQVSQKKAEIQSGLYGDLRGSLRKAGQSGADSVACTVEWSDLDPAAWFARPGELVTRTFPRYL